MKRGRDEPDNVVGRWVLCLGVGLGPLLDWFSHVNV